MPLFLFRVCVYVIIFIFKPLKKTSFLLPYSCFCKYTFIEVSKKYCLRPHCLLTDKKTACHLANSRSPIFEKWTHKITFSTIPSTYFKTVLDFFDFANSEGNQDISFIPPGRYEKLKVQRGKEKKKKPSKNHFKLWNRTYMYPSSVVLSIYPASIM